MDIVDKYVDKIMIVCYNYILILAYAKVIKTNIYNPHKAEREIENEADSDGSNDDGSGRGSVRLSSTNRAPNQPANRNGDHRL